MDKAEIPVGGINRPCSTVIICEDLGTPRHHVGCAKTCYNPAFDTSTVT